MRYKNKNLTIENIKVDFIAKKFNTPCYCYSYKKLRENTENFKNNFKDINPLTCFAVKANPNKIILKELGKLGLGADVTILDRSLPRLRQLDDIFNGQVKTVYSTVDAIEHYSANADLVVGAVLIPGAAAPKLLNREQISAMKPGSVLVDVAIDQGGCFETSKATTHQDPVYVIDDVVHYCVANMPGGVARTSTMALNNATLPFGLALANKGPANAMLEDKHLLNGLNVHEGKVTYKAVVDALGEKLGLTYTPAEEALKG